MQRPAEDKYEEQRRTSVSLQETITAGQNKRCLLWRTELGDLSERKKAIMRKKGILGIS